jgi:hypothetical protein
VNPCPPERPGAGGPPERPGAGGAARLRLALGALALAMASSVAGCGLRADDHPEEIPPDRLNPLLFQKNTDAQPWGKPADLYVMATNDDIARLVRYTVRVPAGPYEEMVLDALLAWVPPDETTESRRLTSSIPHGMGLRSATRSADELVVDLTDLTIQGPGQVQALAQIVYTATAMAGIDGVRFAVDGKPLAVPLGDTTSAPGARVGRSDFVWLEPDTAVTTVPVPQPDSVATPATPGSDPARQ